MTLRDWHPTQEEAFDAFDIDERGELIRDEIAEQVLPQIERRVAAATNIAPVRLAYFQRRARNGGRRCSCFEIGDNPSSTCRACFGTGVVGGYQKLGFQEEVIDVTRLNARGVNVEPLYFRTADTPRRWGLRPGCTRGYLELEVPLTPNQGIIDAFRADYEVAPDSFVNVSVRAPSDSGWVPLGQLGDLSGPDAARAVLAARLSAPQLAFHIDFVQQGQIVPRFEHLYFRYQVAEDKPLRKNQPGTFVKADPKRTPKSIVRGQPGLQRAYEVRTFYMDGSIRALTTEDFFEDLSTGERWKVEVVNDGTSQGVTFEWVVTARIVQFFSREGGESYARVP